MVFRCFSLVSRSGKAKWGVSKLNLRAWRQLSTVRVTPITSYTLGEVQGGAKNCKINKRAIRESKEHQLEGEVGRQGEGRRKDSGEDGRRGLSMSK